MLSHGPIVFNFIGSCAAYVGAILHPADHHFLTSGIFHRKFYIGGNLRNSLLLPIEPIGQQHGKGLPVDAQRTFLLPVSGRS